MSPAPVYLAASIDPYRTLDRGHTAPIGHGAHKCLVHARTLGLPKLGCPNQKERAF